MQTSRRSLRVYKKEFVPLFPSHLPRSRSVISPARYLIGASSGKICRPAAVFLKKKTQTGTREASESRGQREKWREDGEEGDRRYVLRGEESGGGRRLRVAVKSCLLIAAVFMQPPKRSINSQLLERGSDYWVVLERDK